MRRASALAAAGAVAFAVAVAALATDPPAVGAATGAAGPAGARRELRLTPVGRHDFLAPSTSHPALAAEELSGIAWMGGSLYVAVGDEHACLQFLAIRLDPATGRVVSALFREPVRLGDEDGRPLPDPAEGPDREGIAYDERADAVWIANERTGTDTHHPSIARHSVGDGRRTMLVTTESDSALGVFARLRVNLGFESVTRSRRGDTTWTANEGPLTIDGPPASANDGGMVRLQRFDRAMRPVTQVAYRVDPYPARIASPALLAGRETSGLSDLLLLPDGRLLALERAFAGDSTGVAGLRIRIYEVDPAGATDISRGPAAGGLASLRAGTDYIPAGKRLLWEQVFGLTNSNFEGMTLGPGLRNGDRVLILVADNNGGSSQALYTLRLRGLATRKR